MWLKLLTGGEAALSGFVAFVVPDLVKIALTVTLARRLKPLILRSR